MHATRMTGGEAIAQSLLSHGVDTVFGIPGVQTYALFDAWQRAGDRVRVIGPRHEQTTAYMAFGYAKSTGKPGVYCVVPGPGVLNTTAALCSAYGASAPVLCLTGQVPSDYIGSGKGHLHELPDQLATLRTLTKWAARIEHPGEAPHLVAEAFRQMLSGRPRPAALEMPWNVFGMQAPVELGAAPAGYPPMQPDPDLIERAARLLERARNPMIMVGGGAQHAAQEVLSLAELIQAPVVSFRSGRGVVGDDHPLGFTCAAGFKRWPETDLLIGIGSRLELQWFRWPDQPASLKIVDIDIDPTQMARIKPTVGIVGDAKEATAQLADAARRLGVRRALRRAEFQAVKDRTLKEIRKVRPHIEYLEVIREVLPRDGFFVEEICQAGFTSYFGFPVYLPRTFVSCGHQGTLGFGFPTALGVKVGNPGKAVVSIAGDGGFMFGVQDLATAVQYGINVVTVLFNNNAYGNVARDQERLFDGRLIGSELRNPDFVKLAESFGVAAARVDTPAQLKAELDRALARDAPALIEVTV
ncbi:MAG TPA: thiamine pyrophosphate-dependent enzyme, partial [Burkholderiales bacterium]|nr:thiamine pyrophosphate-dependent enzyme [Burkholderiales bacterium]